MMPAHYRTRMRFSGVLVVNWDESVDRPFFSTPWRCDCNADYKEPFLIDTKRGHAIIRFGPSSNTQPLCLSHPPTACSESLFPSLTSEPRPVKGIQCTASRFSRLHPSQTQWSKHRRALVSIAEDEYKNKHYLWLSTPLGEVLHFFCDRADLCFICSFGITNIKKKTSRFPCWTSNRCIRKHFNLLSPCMLMNK